MKPPRWRCPGCGTRLEPIVTERRPRADDTFECCACRAVLIVTVWRTLRPLTEADFELLPAAHQKEILALRPPPWEAQKGKAS